METFTITNAFRLQNIKASVSQTGNIFRGTIETEGLEDKYYIPYLFTLTENVALGHEVDSDLDIQEMQREMNAAIVEKLLEEGIMVLDQQ